MKFIRTILIFQTIYYFITGLWPIIDIHSFMMVTGPKTDIWLVKTVGVLICAISISWLAALIQNEIGLPAIILALVSALGLMAIDIHYAFNDVIWNIYLADAVIQVILIILILPAAVLRKRELTS